MISFTSYECIFPLKILQDMMTEIQALHAAINPIEWKRGGLTTIPLLVLLGE